MNFLHLAAARRSVREYAARAVGRDKLSRCLEAARLAPSACNGQPWRFVVLDEPSVKNDVARRTFGRVLSFNHFALSAPVIVLVCASRSALRARIGAMIRRTSFGLIDVGIAASHFCLQATEEGLGTCILGWFAERSIRRLLGLPRDWRIVLAITVGYPADEGSGEKKRRSLDTMVQYNRGRKAENGDIGG